MLRCGDAGGHALELQQLGTDGQGPGSGGRVVVVVVVAVAGLLQLFEALVGREAGAQLPALEGLCVRCVRNAPALDPALVGLLLMDRTMSFRSGVTGFGRSKMGKDWPHFLPKREKDCEPSVLPKRGKD